MISEYGALLEEETFKRGEQEGSVRTALTVLTDMLIELNALEIFYQKPVSKSISPSELRTLRSKIETVKELLQTALKATS